MIAIIVAMAVILPARAESWQLKPLNSLVGLQRSGDEDISDALRLGPLGGQVDENGNAKINILASAGLRTDPGMERHFADISSQVDLSSFDDLQSGASRKTDLALEISANGQTVGVQTQVQVTRIDESIVEVESIDPLQIDPASLKLDLLFIALKGMFPEAAADDGVPVVFRLRFERWPES